MGAEKLTGTPWHVVKIPKKRRVHEIPESKCKFFRKAGFWCDRYERKCYKLENCDYYRSTGAETTKKEASSKNNTNQSKKYHVGLKVRHSEYGFGIVQHVDEYMLTVRFDQSGTQKVEKTSVRLYPHVEKSSRHNGTQHKNKGEKTEKNSTSASSNSLGKYFPGHRVVHKTFGEGIVTECTKTAIKIRFEDFGEKTMDYNSCEEKGLLS